jgi:hypothetical protein
VEGSARQIDSIGLKGVVFLDDLLGNTFELVEVTLLVLHMQHGEIIPVDRGGESVGKHLQLLVLLLPQEL